MPQPYSPDLRERVLVACERGDLPQVEIARRFQVCPATVSNWRRQEREEGRRAAKPHSGGVLSGRFHRQASDRLLLPVLSGLAPASIIRSPAD